MSRAKSLQVAVIDAFEHVAAGLATADLFTAPTGMRERFVMPKRNMPLQPAQSV